MKRERERGGVGKREEGRGLRPKEREGRTVEGERVKLMKGCFLPFFFALFVLPFLERSRNRAERERERYRAERGTEQRERERVKKVLAAAF